jgi:hypothetical protein
MKNFVKWSGIIALVAVIGFSFAACDDDLTGGGGNLSGGNPSGGNPSGGGDSRGNFTFVFENKSTKTVKKVTIEDGADGNKHIVKDITIAPGATSDPWTVSLVLSSWYDNTAILKMTATFSDNSEMFHNLAFISPGTTYDYTINDYFLWPHKRD